MHVLTTPLGNLVVPAGPIVDDWCDHGMTCLRTHGRVQTVIVADQNITLEQLEAAAGDLGAAAITDVTQAMAADAVEIAAEYPAGTMLRASFDETSLEWTFITEAENTADQADSDA